MEPTANPIEIIQYIPQPAFLVKDGVVTQANAAATDRQIKIGTPVAELITLGAEDYEVFVSGKLYLELKSGRAWISICGDMHLFCIEDSFSSPELRAFALAAQHLRAPLSNAISGTELLLQNETLQQSTALKMQLGQINRSLYQMIRAVCNMSDVSQLGSSFGAKREIQNIAPVFDEIFEKAAALIEDAGRTLKFRGLKHGVDSAIDVQLLERAVLNLISNAIKFSPQGSTIQSVLKQNGNRLTLTVENRIQDGLGGMYGNTFSRFLREPGIESSQIGIGLGMSIVSHSVAAHRGTVLLDTSRKNCVKITVSIPIDTSYEPGLKSPMILLDGYTGGIDNYLVELSDVLPNHYYELI